ncbi:hypothetical protein BV898_19170 [Hypsibius exemplaris]|uniref:Uncharacterized protein n=1 Tax=Hypsibius exemplaris TaxID=2072580 RepID=A0A9X6NIS9_HYPEX|nr:hypothetical protein BV898_19170 [Hypsibius exemplaris]
MATLFALLSTLFFIGAATSHAQRKVPNGTIPGQRHSWVVPISAAALSNGRVGGSQNAEQARSFPGGAILPVKVGTTSMVIQTDGSALETTAQFHGSSVPMQGIVPYEVPSDQQIQSFRSLIPRSDYLPAGVLPLPDSRA